MLENIKSDLKKLKEIILFCLLAMWMIIPVLKDIRLTRVIITNQEYPFIIFVGVVGLFCGIFDICINIKKATNKKEYFKEILPIVILLIFMIWTFVSCLYSPNTDKAFWGTSYRKDGYITYLGYAGFFFCASLINSKKNKKILINTLVIVAILNIIITELANMGILTEIFVTKSISTTGFYQFNHFGYYLLLATVSSMFLFITQKNKILKILYLISYVFLLYYLILNNTFGCYLAITVTLILFIIYCIYHKKNRIIAMFVTIVFILMSVAIPKTRAIVQKNINVFARDIKNIITAQQIQNDFLELEEIEAIEMADEAGTGRMALWKNGISFFLERPLLGYGPDNLGIKYYSLGVSQDRPHNLLIQLATTSGIIGLITYVTAIAIIWIRGLKRTEFNNPIHIISFFVITAYLISAMFGNSMYYTSPYFFIFLGFLMCENINAKRDKENNKNSKV